MSTPREKFLSVCRTGDMAAIEEGLNEYRNSLVEAIAEDLETASRAVSGDSSLQTTLTRGVFQGVANTLRETWLEDRQ